MYSGTIHAKHEGQRPYYLTDPETDQRNPWPEIMDWAEACDRNDYLVKQGCRWRWTQAEAMGATD